MLEVKIAVDPGCEDLPLPEYQTSGSSGMDLHAAVDVTTTIEAGKSLLVPTGIRVEIPEGFEAQIRPRSGIALKHQVSIVNAPGTIDSDYRGEIGVILINHGKAAFVISRGDRIAQMIFSKVEKANLIKVDNVTESPRNDGGFGHTGVNDTD